MQDLSGPVQKSSDFSRSNKFLKYFCSKKQKILIAKIDDSKNKIDVYCEAHTTPQSDLLYQLERETYLKTLAPQMASGHLQGQLLTMLCQLIQPKIALEIGTFTGYASICIANGLPPNSILHTIEVNEEIAYISNKYFQLSEVGQKIKPYLGDAKDICLLYSSPSPRDATLSRMPSSA